jgi:hypothetical protein
MIRRFNRDVGKNEYGEKDVWHMYIDKFVFTESVLAPFRAWVESNEYDEQTVKMVGKLLRIKVEGAGVYEEY